MAAGNLSFMKTTLIPTALEGVIRWTAHWIKRGGRSLNKPTHFEVRDGAY